MKKLIASTPCRGSALANRSTASLWFAVAMFILSVLLLAWAVFPHLPQQVRQYIREVNMQRQQQELRRLLAKDPKPGQVMDVPAVDLSGKPLPSGEELWLVFVGRVNRHNREHIIKWLDRELGRTNAKWVVVAIGEEDDLQAIQRASGNRFQVVSDVKGRLHTRWNAVVLPRVYEVDSTGKLRLIRRPERGCGGCTGCGGD